MFRISSLPSRDQLFQPRDLVTSPPPGAPGTEPEAQTKESGGSEAVIVDLTPARSRQSASDAAKAVAAANAEAAASPGRDMKAIAGMLRNAAQQNPGQMIAAQGVPDAGRVLGLLYGN